MAKKRDSVLNLQPLIPDKQVVQKATTKQSKDKNAKFSFAASFGEGRAKVTGFSAADLRSVARSNSIVQLCVSRIKNHIATRPWIVRSVDKKMADQVKPHIDYVTNLLKHPNDNDDTNRTIISKMADDLLIFDQGVWEKVRNSKGMVVQLYQVDGATIRPNLDDYGMFKDPAYYQYLSNGTKEPDATFEIDDLCIFQANPVGVAGRIGYGISPVEQVINTVVTSIQAMLYNADFFDGSKIPPALINLKGATTDQLNAFKLEWEAKLQGKPWSNAYVNAEDVAVNMLRQNNQEMQFYELNLWLARIIFAGFGLSAQDFGFTQDVNKATAQVQSNVTHESGYMFYSDVITEEINTDLIGDLAQYDPLFNEIEFAYEEIDLTDPRTQADIDKIYVDMGKNTVDELRQRDGEDPLTEDQKLEIVNSRPQPISFGQSLMKSQSKWQTFYQ